MAKSSPGVARLLASMRKLVLEVNDQEICRRLEILMHSEKEDLPPPLIKRLLESPADFEGRAVPEPYTQYVRHFLYMVKRREREKAREDKNPRKKTTRAARTRKKAASEPASSPKTGAQSQGSGVHAS